MLVLKIITCAFLFLLGAPIAKAQIYDFEQKVPFAIKFIISPHVVNPLLINHGGEKILESVPTGSLSVGLGLYSPLSRNFGINASVMTGIVPYRFRFFYLLPRNYYDNLNVVDLKSSDYFIVYHSFPLTLQRYFHYKKNYFWGVKAGVAPTYIYPFETKTSLSLLSSQDTSSILLFAINVDNTKRNWYTNFQFGIGMAKQTKKGNLIELNAILNYSPRKIGSGTYQFSNIPALSFGEVELGMNYIGLEFSYGLSFRPK